MRVAALYDIHGNLPALEAVLEEVRREGADAIVIGGDVVPGPMASEALKALSSLERPVHYVRGNCESAVLAALEGGALPAVPESVRELMRWTARALPAEQSRRLAAWPLTLTLEIPELGPVLFCHATPRDDNEIFTRRTPEEALRPLFEPLGVGLVVCGHTHMQFDRPIGPVRVVNAGSVGMPYGEPGAYWALLGPDVSLRRTPYDLGTAAARVRATAYPEAEAFAARNVLEPPSEAEMLGIFAGAGPGEKEVMKGRGSGGPT